MVLLTVIALAYLYQHSYSIKMTRELMRLETEKKLALERVESINAQLKKLQSFCRLESLYLSGVRSSIPMPAIAGENPAVKYPRFGTLTLANPQE